MTAPLLLWGGAAIAALLLSKGASGARSTPLGTTTPKTGGTILGSPTGGVSNSSSSSSGGAPVPSLTYPDSYYDKNSPTNVGVQTGSIAGPVGALLGKISDAIYNNSSTLNQEKVDTFNAVENFQATIPQPFRPRIRADVTTVVPVTTIPAQPGFTGHIGAYDSHTNVTSGGTTSSGAPAQSYAGTGSSAGVSGSGDAGSSTGGSGD